MAKRRRRTSRRTKRFEEQGRRLGKELGQLVGRLERRGRVAARKGKLMQGEARRHSVRTLRRGAWALSRLALQLEKSGRTPRRGRSRSRRRKKRSR